MKLEGLDHPKTLDLASRLDVTLPTVIGHLEFLWAFTSKKSAQGNIGKWPNGAIARACYWMGNPDDFITALVECGFLDAHHEHRLLIHDWHEHAPGWVRAKLKKLGQAFLTISQPTSERSLEPSIQGKGSTREGKGSTSSAYEVLESIKIGYPAGTFGAQNWILAERAIGKLLDAGETPDTLASAAAAYREQMDAKGSTGTQFIRSPEKFYGDGFWRGPFPLPVAAKKSLAANLTWTPAE